MIESKKDFINFIKSLPKSIPPFKSVFDVPVKGSNNEPMFLEQFRGKVLIFINTTGHCGNVPQWPIIDEIQKEYQDKNVQVIYVPTNDYCGSVTYAPYKKGISHASESIDFAKKTYGIEGVFTELLSSRNEVWKHKYDELKNGEWQHDEELIKKAESEIQPPKSDLFSFLVPEIEEPIHGNFTKFITNQDGFPVARFADGTFLNIEHSIDKGIILTPEEEIFNFKEVLNEVLLTGFCTNPRYAYYPYNLFENISE